MQKLSLSPVMRVCLSLVGWFLTAGENYALTPQEQAGEILDAAGVKGGLVVHLDCGDGELTAALGAEESFLVHGLDTSAADVANARANIKASGRYGRVAVDHWTGTELPYVDNLVNLVVAENHPGISDDEIMRVLCPNGVAYIKVRGSWTKFVKPRPSEIDEWTHYLHDATNNAVANDTVVGPPRRSQWLGSPRWSRHHDRMASTSACVSANGRIFYIIDEGSRACIQLPSRWSLIARDAFNGTILWKQPIAAWVTQLWPFKSGPALPQRRLVAFGDRVYVTLGLDGTPLSTLDAATGEIIRTHPNTTMTEEIIFSDGTLLIVVKDTPSATTWNDYRPIHRTIGNAKTRVADEFPWDEKDRAIMALDADTGGVLWQKRSPIAPLTLAADANGVYFHDANSIVRWDRDTGEQLWSSDPIPIWSPMPTKFGPTLVIHKNVVLFEGGDPGKAITAVSAKTGETLWASSHPATGHNCPYDLLVIDDLAWVGAIAGGSHSGIFTGWDINTGEVKKEFPPDVDTYWFHHRCYRAKATVNYLLPARTGTEFIDFRNETWTIHHWVRGGCLYGVMPCNGLLYTPPHNCACYLESKQYGFGALAAAASGREHPRVETDDDRFQEGPAYSTPLTDPPGTYDWPTYRCETTRSGHTKSIVGTGLRTKWQARLSGDLTTLTIANGRVYLADKEEHTLFALDEDSGSVLWTYTAGGRVDSPPTIYRGRVIFGSADGYVHCLRASDGALVWRFQAAPQDLRMASFEQIESVWPLHGSVLVQDDMVYCVAGRSMFLDGGLRFLRLNPETGKKISEKVLDDTDPESGQNLHVHVKRLNMPVAQPDILSGDGEYVYMHSQRFDLEGNRQDIAPYSGDHNEQGAQQYGVGMHLFSPTGFLDGEYMHRTYWVFGKSWASGAGGYHRAGAYAPAGRLMAFDDSRIYGYGRYPVYYKWSTPLEYELFCVEKYPASDKIEYHWSNKSVPILVQAMVLADKTLFIAGAPDVVDEEKAFDYWSADPNDPNTDRDIPAKLDEQDAALENLRGGLLRVVDTADGNSTAEHNLESLPVWDGMLAANGCLYIALQNGKVICLEGSNYPPVVDAGANQTVYPRASVLLDPNITDDGLPLTDPCDPNSNPVGITTRWTKVSGPGDVNFADPCSADTTATFSEWGAYTLRVTTFDGNARYYDDIDVSVSRPGDLDRDYDVDIFDVELLVAHWLSPECDPENDWCSGADQSAGGDVALEDYSITAANWFAGVYPAPPQDLTAEAGENAISLSWADNTEADLAGYNIYRSTAPGSGYTRLNELLLTEPNFIDSNAVSLLTYHYTITACDTYGFESDFSTEISAGAGPQPVLKLIAGLGVKTAGLYVTKWEDQAGNNDAGQTDAEFRPVLASRAINMKPAIAFDGTGQHLDVGDSDAINTGGPYSAKTLVVVFKTSSDITSRQVIWEQGGGVRGLNIYLDGGNLYINGWNSDADELQWGPTGLAVPVLRDRPYVAALVMDATSGVFEGFVNGSSIGVSEGIGQLYGHSNDCAIGHVEGVTKFHDLTGNDGPANFLGLIAEFYHFNRVLAPSDRQTLESLLMDKYVIAF